MEDASLDALRQVGDPVLDPIVGELLPHLAVLDAAFDRLRNVDPLPEDLPGRDVFATLDLPGWVEPARLHRAAAVFERHGFAYAMLLGTVSLLECYAMTAGVKALYGSYRMRDDTARRVGSTGRFVLALLGPGAFGPEGGARGLLLRIRLLHAVSRRRVGSAPGWDPGLGVPLCQEDQLGTLLAFGFSPMAHLQELGADVTTGDIEDVLHLWAVAGAVLGVPVEFLPRTEADAWAVVNAIFRRHLGPSAEGRELAAALMRTYGSMMPGARSERLLGVVLRGLVGPDVADALALPRDRWVARLPMNHLGLRTWGRLRDGLGLGRRIARLQHGAMAWHADRMVRAELR